MPRLFVPPTVKRELVEERARFASVVRQATHEDHICEKWNRELVRLDPLLRLVKADHFVIGTPLVAGAYHLLRANETAPMTVTPIVDSTGRPLPEPPGKLLEQLQGMDLQNERVERMHQRIRDAEVAREQRRVALVREQRQHHILENWRAVDRASVSMNPDTPWTQNASGRKPAKRKGDG